MRVLCKCHECRNWFQHENGCDDEQRISQLVERVPRVYEVMRCDYCKSLDARNDVHIFMEPFEGLIGAGLGPLNLMPALKRAGVTK